MGAWDGKVIVITGAGTGLGRAAAALFAKEGASVVLNGRRSSKLLEVKRLIEDFGGKAIIVQGDISVPETSERIVMEAVEQFGTIDVLINNAAVLETNALADTTFEAWNTQIGTNLTGVFLATKAVLPVMRKHRAGRIINITSGLAANGAGGYAAYSVSKAGVESLTRTTIDEEADYGITAALFNPGTVKSGMHATGQDPEAVVPALLELAAAPQSKQIHAAS
ncbi:SDR family NAD(P)-dependent oxidoreductase [Paenibacillus turpanensis]|uniref:SDR family NAD(P)-dependent oxidoreductase n=1 Tax=Paenibacillus turpanensis TaxID=2689078 RepID=UPI00140E09C1|nr:SDR family NAD(P)-dependent oxidoreductase [Paenibacillus turpanensis]